MAPQLFPRKIVDWARLEGQKAVKATTAPQCFRRFDRKKIITELRKKNAENQDQ